MREIILQGQAEKLRAALFEDNGLVEVFEGDESGGGLVGNIYLGRVENVLPGMQAAFVDIGLEKNAFLYVGDAVPPHTLDEEERPVVPPDVRVEQVLRPRQQLLVQIMKEPVGNKGARVTTNLTLPGRYTVLVPQVDYVGVSRKILDPEERERLRSLAAEVRPDRMGVVVRTLAQGAAREEIREDLGRLAGLWRRLREKKSTAPVPGLLHRDLELILRLVRDLVDQEVTKIIADREEVAEVMREALADIGHPASRAVSVDPSGSLFSRYGVDDEVRKALRPKVWLKSGGYLVVNSTEALVAIDVNTGKYVGKRSLAETVLRTNLEAAKEVARQLRLRNLGGIIIIDFIDMDAAADQERVLQALEEACLPDRIKCHILGLTQLGLVEMTRKKVGRTLAARFTKPCQACDGHGYLTMY
ncbi:ribonuclease G [Peptococcaceae bacterium CEB3]|nr:ribonuclease G [Peptococcaceae bacterium CEB3]